MYTDTSTFRIRNGYGGFTMPKSLLTDLGWGSGDLLEFWGLSEVIRIQKIHTKEELQELKKKGEVQYNKEWNKKIAKFGGAKGTLGVKTFPAPLISEFKIKDGQKIYFLPEINTWLGEGKKSQDIVLMAFNKRDLNRLDKLSEEDKEKEQEEWKKRLADHYHLHFFHGRSEISEKNSPKTKRKVLNIDNTINKDAILALKAEIKRAKETLKKEVPTWPNKEGNTKRAENYIKNLEMKVEELKTNPRRIFKEDKINTIGGNKENISSS